MKKILLTGFERFRGESINPSQLVVERLVESHKEAVDGHILPVSYERAFSSLKSRLEKGEYEIVLMLGQAAGRKLISFERVAINLMDSKNSDEDQIFKVDQKILKQGPDAFLSELPLLRWTENLKRENFPVEISNTAGTFVCNALYYKVLSFLREQSVSCQALFIHVPYLPEQLSGKPPETASLSLDVMLKTIARLIQESSGFQ